MNLETFLLNKMLDNYLYKIKKHLNKKNLFKDIDPIFLNDSIKIEFEKLDSLMFLSDNMPKKITEPYFYLKYEKNQGGTHYNLMFAEKAFKYIYLDKIAKKINTNEITVSDQAELLIVVYMKIEKNDC